MADAEFSATVIDPLPPVLADEALVLRYGSCVGSGTDWWTNVRNTRSKKTQRAIAICNECPVQGLCLQVGLRVDAAGRRCGGAVAVVGIWGGKLPGERYEMLRGAA